MRDWTVTEAGRVVFMDVVDAMEGLTPYSCREDALKGADEYLDHRMFVLLAHLQEVEDARLHNRTVAAQAGTQPKDIVRGPGPEETAQAPAETVYRVTWERIERLGFVPIDTGGGCMAYQLDLSGDRYVLVTRGDGASLPGADDREVLFGVYDDHGEELGPVVTVEIQALEEAVKRAQR